MGINRSCRICYRYALSQAAATLPANDAWERMQYTYTYDSLLHTYPAAVANSFGKAIQTKKGLRTGGSDMMLVSGRTVDNTELSHGQPIVFRRYVGK